MRIVLIGSTGFIGRELVPVLFNAGHQVTGITRDIAKAKLIFGDTIGLAEWNGRTPGDLAQIISGSDAVINLAGDKISSGRWTRSKKIRIRDSRISTGHLITKAVRMAPRKPSVLIQGSATGYYGVSVNEPAGETTPSGNGFLANLTRDWEASVEPLEKEVRLILIRTGIVLGMGGGMLEKILIPFKFYSGAIPGPGSQWVPWIHIRDQANAIRFLLENENCTGPFNLVSPEAARMNIFIQTLARMIGRPARIRIPDFLIKAVLGEMAEETILASQHIVPEKLAEAGFSFEYPDLSRALKNLLSLK